MRLPPKMILGSSQGVAVSPMRSTALAFLALLGSSAAHAQSVESFYRSRTINLVVGYSVGGGYDIHGQVLARHLGNAMLSADFERIARASNSDPF